MTGVERRAAGLADVSHDERGGYAGEPASRHTRPFAVTLTQLSVNPRLTSSSRTASPLPDPKVE